MFAILADALSAIERWAWRVTSDKERQHEEYGRQQKKRDATDGKVESALERGLCLAFIAVGREFLLGGGRLYRRICSATTVA
jgi:hypothetical protein